MTKLEKHVFICINERPAGHASGCCKSKGSEEILGFMKEEIKKRGLAKKIRVNKAGCLDQCSKGAAIVVYPEGVWYGHVTKEDVLEIVDKHLIGNDPVSRLRIDL